MIAYTYLYNLYRRIWFLENTINSSSASFSFIDFKRTTLSWKLIAFSEQSLYWDKKSNCSAYRARSMETNII